MKMNEHAYRAFLTEVRPAILSLNDADRGPLCSPVWYDQNNDGSLWFVTQSHSRKGKLMSVGTRITLTVQRHKAPYAYVSAEGPIVEIRPYTLEDDLLPMASRYLGTEGGQAYVDGARDGFNPQTSIRLTMQPDRILSTDYSS
jgi:hypothetical protein